MKQLSHVSLNSRAIVIGGGIGGMVAARVLADHYQEVTVLDRDVLPVFAEQRRGVPQGRHAHGILASGRRALESLFPGISARLMERGALPMDIARDARWVLQNGSLARCTSGLEALLASRPLLESEVRLRVSQLPNVRVLDDRDVTDLVAAPDRERIIGVNAAGRFMPADLVVDVAGRGSRSPQWLEALGYCRPVEERIEIGLGYTTRWFRRVPSQLNGDLAAVIPPTPELKRGGVMLAQEGDRWIVTLVSHFGNNAPTEVEGFIDYTKTLAAPYIYEALRNAEPLGKAATARFPASVWKRYDQVDRFPEGYLVFGDAISSFNPRYGQGMSVAVLQAMELSRTLQDSQAGLARRFFERAAKVIEIPWTIAASNDLRMKEVKGRRTLRAKFINWYMARLQRAAHHDRSLALAFHQVANLLAPPPSLMRPAVAWRVFRGNRPKAEGQSVPGWRASQVS